MCHAQAYDTQAHSTFTGSKHFYMQDMKPGSLVLLRNSARDSRKGDKLAERWLGPYKVKEHLGKDVYRLQNPNTHRILKKTYNGCRYCSCSCILHLFVYLLVHYHI